MHRRIVLRSALIAGVFTVAGIGAWLTVHAIDQHNARCEREALQAQLPSQIGRPIWDVMALLKLEDAERSWVDEPPGKLRGVSYHRADGLSVTIYIAAGELMFRRFSEKNEWDFEAVLACRVGGIQYEWDGVEASVGHLLWH